MCGHVERIYIYIYRKFCAVVRLGGLAPVHPIMHLPCCQGDTIDDLCRPEYDDELEELKQLCEVHV